MFLAQDPDCDKLPKSPEREKEKKKKKKKEERKTEISSGRRARNAPTDRA